MSSFISNLQFERAKYKNPELLKKLDGILFPLGDKSLETMTIDEVNSELGKALENRLHQGTASGNIELLAKKVSNNQIEIDISSTIPAAIKLIFKNQHLIIQKYKDHGIKES